MIYASVTDGADSQPECCIQKDIEVQSDDSIKTEKFSCSINYAIHIVKYL